MSVEINKIKESVQFFAKTLAAAVEEKLGDRSAVEEKVRNFARQVEKTVVDNISNVTENMGQQRKAGPVNIRVKTLSHFKGDMPKYETSGASGVDVRAAIKKPIEIQPGERVMIPTGLQVAIPEGYEIQARPRSGHAVKQGMTLLNTPGTIDADYRGEIKIIAINLGQEPITIKDQERIAQLVVCPVIQATFDLVEDLDETVRGEGGFGSTGV
jgi:dUTP pyrophosphatase